MAEILISQNSDGGWSKQALGDFAEVSDVSDAYATSIAVLALAAVGGEENNGEIQSAIDWLISCQNPDGSWSSSSFNRRRESGFVAEFMSHAATGYSIAALQMTRY